MMTGRLYIDGTDAYSEWGMYLADGALKDLVKTAALKKINITEWAEDDGEEADLSHPLLDTKTVSLQFFLSDKADAGAMNEHLADGAYHIFSLPRLGAIYKLRLVSNPRFETSGSLVTMTLNFADDFPPALPPQGLSAAELAAWKEDYDPAVHFLEEQPLTPEQSDTPMQGYALDGTDLSLFGLRVIRGTEDSIAKAPDIKSNLLVNSQYRGGASYDPANVRYKAKDAILKLLLTTTDTDQFWQRWYAMHTALLKPDERILYCESTLEEYTCFFKGCKIDELTIYDDGAVWCKISLTLRFTNVRPMKQYLVLATEEGEMISTEEEEEMIVIELPKTA